MEHIPFHKREVKVWFYLPAFRLKLRKPLDTERVVKPPGLNLCIARMNGQNKPQASTRPFRVQLYVLRRAVFEPHIITPSWSVTDAARCFENIEAANNQPQLEPAQRAATSQIAEVQRIPPSFLAKIISQLSIAGLIHTSRGARGGVSLARPPEAISVLEVVEAIDGPLMLKERIATKMPAMVRPAPQRRVAKRT